MWIPRDYEKTLKALFEQFPVVVLTGARQVGKTSLVRRLFPDFSYVSLDLPSLAEQAEHSPESFLRSYQEPLIIDEVQYAPSIFRFIKILVDENKKAGRFIVTGSQNFLLMQGVSESLAGRCGVLSMQNLAFGELLKTFPDFDDDRYLFKGGFAELYLRPEIEPQFWYAAYLSTYLERDVRNVLNVGSLRDFDRFLRAVAMRTGRMLSYSDLARDVGIAPNTAKAWMSVLHASGQIILLEPYYRSLGKRLVKSPKVYLCDTGLAAFLMGFEKREDLLRHPAYSSLWETHVVMQVFRYYLSRGKHPPLWYWRTAHGSEVDLLVERGGQFVAIEVKSAENPDKGCTKGIEALRETYGRRSITGAFIAAKTLHPYPLSETIEVVPGSIIVSYLSEGEK